ncbi:PP2C family protein-serine/threonine phosphatase [Desulfonatronovibrio magnus]|uniref:PP2C family protein-serine/threonine phosphatase n=1 Tax=Desulfonatronovibrio magnus TaxID=698827 RepID=UPI0006987E59|nr:SpoIIE family protein phosphatase [Desulfonatronovibrio magnus]RQD60710.1 MAG: response regulator [Desulfonatronovibrio sp. MSAO_Bac4]
MYKDWRPKILIVDDAAQNLTILGTILKRDYDVVAATSGEEALRIAFGREQPDLVLLDILMPGMDGYEVCRRLKNDSKTESTPIIFVTAKATSEDEARGLSLGAVDYITKPYQVHIIRARVKTQIELFKTRKKLHQANVMLTTELESMNELQKSVLPAEPFKSNHIFAHGVYHLPGVAGGDYFDYVPLADGGLRCVVADVSGHGARAAFIMAMVRTTFRLDNCCTLSLAKLINSLNRQLIHTFGDEGDFVTLFAADFFPQQKEIEYINAGHCPAFFIDENGFNEVDATGPLLGVNEHDYQINVIDGSGLWRMLLYTDGLYESEDIDQGIIGYEAFRDVCQELLIRDDFDVLDLPRKIADSFSGILKVNDDQTALYIRRL